MQLETFLGILGPALMAVLGAFALWLQAIARKIDENTRLTRDGTAEASRNARIAADVAIKAKEASDTAASKASGIASEIATKLNGGIGAAIQTALILLRNALLEHMAQDEKNTADIKTALDTLGRRVK